MSCLVVLQKFNYLVFFYMKIRHLTWNYLIKKQQLPETSIKKVEIMAFQVILSYTSSLYFSIEIQNALNIFKNNVGKNTINPLEVDHSFNFDLNV
jgi:hypothetical protein